MSNAELSREDALAHVLSDTDRLLDAARRAGMPAPVGPCPGWAVRDLLWHVGEVHWFWRNIVEDRRDDPSGFGSPDPVADDDLAEWVRSEARTLHDVLARADPEDRIWTWSRQRNVGFVVRRMAHETALHRLDLETIVGAPTPLAPRFAADGVDEFMTHMVHDTREDAEVLDGVVRLVANDVERQWLVGEGADGLELRDPAIATADATLSASATDVLLSLWRRPTIGVPTVTGDPAVLQRALARVNLD